MVEALQERMKRASEFIREQLPDKLSSSSENNENADNALTQHKKLHNGRILKNEFYWFFLIYTTN